MSESIVDTLAMQKVPKFYYIVLQGLPDRFMIDNMKRNSNAKEGTETHRKCVTIPKRHRNSG